MGTTKNGKLAFVQSLELIPDHHIKYIETLGWLRNRFAHNISSTSYDIKTFFESISPKRRKECGKHLNLIKSSVIGDQEISGQDFFKEAPRIAIFSSGQIILENIRERTIGSQQVAKITKQRLKEYAVKTGPTVIKTSEYNLEKPR